MEGNERTVLVVDDEPSLRLLCRVNLELADARELVGREPIDVVLLDVHVGAGSGLDVLDELEALDLPTRVIMLSGTSEISAELRARVDGVLGKPFALAELSDAVSGKGSGRVANE
jgi:DNA-binding response OmpR family regulator